MKMSKWVPLVSAFVIVAAAIGAATAAGPIKPGDCFDPAKRPSWVPEGAKWCHRCLTLTGTPTCGDTANGRCSLRKEFESCEPQKGEDPKVSACFSCPDSTGLPKTVCLFSFTDAACQPKTGTTATPCNKDNKPGKIGACKKNGDQCTCDNMQPDTNRDGCKQNKYDECTSNLTPPL